MGSKSPAHSPAGTAHVPGHRGPLLLSSPDSLSGLADLLLSPLSPESPSGQPWGIPLPSALPRLTQPEVLADKACGQQAQPCSPHCTPRTSASTAADFSSQKTSTHPSKPCLTTSCCVPAPPHPILLLSWARQSAQTGGERRGRAYPVWRGPQSDWAPAPHQL